ncbi:hypothetical protein Barb6XT_01629 [Bacteroidales bacterium Barb6XT]|nr:hypothetical protein Barb6XT_01629 [Bacteroidales bacterium Barb6XT]
MKQMIFKFWTPYPKGQKISAPHAAQRNVGFTDNAVRKVLKKRYKLQTRFAMHIYLVVLILMIHASALT